MTEKNIDELIYSCSNFWKKQDLGEDYYHIDPMMLKIWSDPKINGEIKKGSENPKRGEGIKRKTSKKTREKLGQSLKERWKDPEYRDHMSIITSNNLKYMWADHNFREMVTMARIDGVKKMWKRPGYRESHSGENNHNWRGGISKEPYPFEFNENLKKRIRDRDGNRCTSCGSTRRLAVHHINYIKEDLRPENLITLCPSCHGKAHYDREDWAGGLRGFHKRAKVKYDDYLTDIKPVGG